jgi:hypothetical protein
MQQETETIFLFEAHSHERNSRKFLTWIFRFRANTQIQNIPKKQELLHKYGGALKKKYLLGHSFISSKLFCNAVRITFRMPLNFALCVYETWSATLREEHRLEILENRIVTIRFGRKGEVT